MADAYLSSVKALFHFDTPSPWVDSAGHAVTQTGTPQTASVAGQFGTSVMDCANGAYLSITHSDMVIPEGGAYTLEARISVPAGLTVTEETTWWVAGNSDIAIGCTLWPGDNDWYMAVRVYQGETRWIGAGPGRDILTHIAISRYSGVNGYLACGINGQVPYSLESGYSPGTTMYFGNLPDGPAFPGKVEEIRFTNRVTRYPGPYTVPSAAFDDPSGGGGVSLSPAKRTLTAQGYAPTIVLPVVLAPVKKTLVLSGHAPTLSYAISISPETAHLTATGGVPLAGIVTSIDPLTGHVTSAGHAPALGIALSPSSGEVRFAPHSPSLGVEISPEKGALRLTGYAAAAVSPVAGKARYRGYSATMELTIPAYGGHAIISGHSPYLKTGNPVLERADQIYVKRRAPQRIEVRT